MKPAPSQKFTLTYDWAMEFLAVIRLIGSGALFFLRKQNIIILNFILEFVNSIVVYYAHNHAHAGTHHFSKCVKTVFLSL